ncbi:hypothetical protein FHG87_015205 [Trinorchestia longiramus]|nr:hypothetical protein FHG87_015205 [Trinorchestia longiramus]
MTAAKHQAGLVKCPDHLITSRHHRQQDGTRRPHFANRLSFLVSPRPSSPPCSPKTPSKSMGLRWQSSVMAASCNWRTAGDGGQVSMLPVRHRSVGPALLAVMLLVVATADSGTAMLTGQHSWQTPGCHKIGHTRRITIPDCVEFDITTNACRGYCESWSVLASHSSSRFSSPFSDQDASSSPRLMTPFITQLGDAGYGLPQQKPHITSVGQCCNIMDSEDVKVKVMCVDGPRELAFKSAKTCSCFHCKKY